MKSYALMFEVSVKLSFEGFSICVQGWLFLNLFSLFYFRIFNLFSFSTNFVSSNGKEHSVDLCMGASVFLLAERFNSINAETGI